MSDFSAAVLLTHSLRVHQNIPTGCKLIDMALEHGLRLGTILELTGTCGSGKTQLAMQIMVNTVLPAPLGLIGGKVFFISTRKSFLQQRVYQLLDSSIDAWNKAVEKLDPKQRPDAKSVTRQHLLGQIQHKMVFSLVDLISTVYQLIEITRKDKNVRLIVIDSFTTHLVSTRLPSDEIRIICELIKVLERIATTAKCAVVLTNDLTVETEGDSDLLRPALGDIFHHLIPQRIFITKSGDGEVVANVQKNLFGGPSLVNLTITANGVRDE